MCAVGVLLDRMLDAGVASTELMKDALFSLGDALNKLKPPPSTPSPPPSSPAVQGGGVATVSGTPTHGYTEDEIKALLARAAQLEDEVAAAKV